MYRFLSYVLEKHFLLMRFGKFSRLSLLLLPHNSRLVPVFPILLVMSATRILLLALTSRSGSSAVEIVRGISHFAEGTLVRLIVHGVPEDHFSALLCWSILGSRTLARLIWRAEK